MGNNRLKTKSYFIRLVTFSILILCFIGLPAFILSYAVHRFYQTDEEQIVNNLKIYSQYISGELRHNLLAEKYFCRLFHEYNLVELNNPNSTIENNIEFCKNLKNTYGKYIDFVVIDNKGDIKYNSNENLYKHSPQDWKDAHLYVRNTYALIPELKGNQKGNSDALKKIFGPQIIISNIKYLYTDGPYCLIWGDSSDAIPPGGVYSFKWGGFFVFISKEVLRDVFHLKYNVLDYSYDKNIITGLYNIDDIDYSFWTNRPIDNKNEIKEALYNSKFSEQKYIELYDCYIYQESLKKKNYVFSIIQKKNTDFAIFVKALLAFLLYFLLSWHIIKYFWNTIVLKVSGEASIGLKIAFLFFFATAIPLLLFAVVSHEYDLHKKSVLIKEAKDWSINTLLGIEQRYQSFLKNLSDNIDKQVDDWSINLKDKV